MKENKVVDKVYQTFAAFKSAFMFHSPNDQKLLFAFPKPSSILRTHANTQYLLCRDPTDDCLDMHNASGTFAELKRKGFSGALCVSVHLHHLSFFSQARNFLLDETQN